MAPIIAVDPDVPSGMPLPLRGLVACLVAFACAWGSACTTVPRFDGEQRPLSIDGSVQPPLSLRNANYTMNASLDPATRRITGSASIEWRNVTSKTTSELQFHLYWNAWKNNESAFMRELVAAGGGGLEADGHGSIDITALELVDSTPVDLMSRRRFVTTDAGRPDDETVMGVDLPGPVAPGESIVVRVEWTAQVPFPIARTGAIGDYYFIAHWFPKLGVLEDAGWNTHQFHASTEFFADYGVYDVSLTVPRGWTIGATGVERERSDETAGTTTHRYYQEDVHDFAWTTSPDYVERTAWFEPQTESGGQAPVFLRLLLQPEHAGQESRHFDAARAAIRAFGAWFGPYPYGHMTIVDPAYQSDADGMEYPTFFTAGTRWLVPDDLTYNTPEEVTVHEAGHQWWQGMVGSNEFEDAWIDEGITTFATARTMEQELPQAYLEERFFGGFVPWVYRDIPVSRATYWNRRAGYVANAESDVPAELSYRYHPDTGPSITYNKTALWLHTLERWIGWDALRAGLKAAFERHRFGHPEPDEVLAALSDGLGRDLTPFFDQVFRSSNEFDYAAETVQSSGSEDVVRSAVVVRRHGEAVFPVDVAIEFADGERIVERWDGADRWRAFEYERSARVVSAEVDPDRILLLDVDFTNNSRTVAPRGREVANKWSLKWIVWLQDAMAGAAMF